MCGSESESDPDLGESLWGAFDDYVAPLVA